MATINLRKGGGAGAYGATLGVIRPVEFIVDFRNTPTSAGDVVQLMDILPGTLVLMGMCLHVERAEGGTLTIDVGDEDDPDGFFSNKDGNSAGYIINQDGLYNAAKAYTAAKVLSIVTDHAADNARIRLLVPMLDYRPGGSGISA